MIPGYKSIKEVSEEWGITPRRVQGMCAEGLIPGATKINNRWVVPVDCDRPADGRETTGEFKNWRKSTQQKKFTTEASGILDILTNMPGGYFIYRADESEEILAVNQALIQMYGCKSEEEFREYTGNSFKGMVHPKDYQKVARSIEKQLSSSKDKSDTLEYRILCRDDTVRTISEYGKLITTKEYGDVFAVFVDEPVDKVTRSLSSLEQTFYRILKVNLMTDSFTIIKSHKNDLTKEAGFDPVFSKWLKNTGLVHPDDRKKFETYMNMGFLPDYFKRTSKPWRLRYRRMVGETYHWVMCEIFRSEEYTPDNQIVELYIQNTDDNFPDMQSLGIEAQGDIQLFQSATQVLYPNCYMVHLVANTYYNSRYDATGKRIFSVDGRYDELTEVEAVSIPDGDMRDDYLEVFGRESLLKAYKEGKKTVEMKYCKIGDDEVLHWMEGRGIFVTPSEADICCALYVRCIDEEMEQQGREEKALKTTVLERTQALEALDILTSLSGEYDRILTADAESGHYEVFSESEEDTLHAQNVLEYMDKYISTEVKEEDRDAFRAWIFECRLSSGMNPGAPVRTYKYRRTVNGSSLYYELCISGIVTKQNKRYNVLAFRNIHEEETSKVELVERLTKERNEAIQKDQEKTQFIFEMSHGVRGPMNSLMGFSGMLLKHRYEDDFQNYVENIQSSSREVMDAFDEIYEMARIEGGMVSVQESPLPEFHNYMDTVLLTQAELAKAKNVSLSKMIQISYGYIETDQYLLNEIYRNTVSTLLKFTNPGGQIFLSVKEIAPKRAGYVTYQTTVEDNESGMNEETYQHLFDGFSGKNPDLSMGITKKAVELLGGTIEAERGAGNGIRFIITLSHRKALHEAPDTMDMEKFRGKRVLLAEDNELNRELAKEILEDLGLTVDTASDGIECVGEVTKENAGYYSAVLMDIQMPNMDGYTATMILRHISDKSKASVPVIALSANVFDEDRKRALDSGMNDFLEKPIDVKRLYMTLAKYIA